jgi:hypothetical protein
MLRIFFLFPLVRTGLSEHHTVYGACLSTVAERISVTIHLAEALSGWFW